MKLVFIRALDKTAGSRVRTRNMAKDAIQSGYRVKVLEDNHRGVLGYCLSSIFKTIKLRFSTPDIVVCVKALPMSTLPAILNGYEFMLDWDDYEAGYGKYKHWPLKHFIAWYEKWVLKKALMVTVHSDYLYNKAKEFGVKHVHRYDQTVNNKVFHSLVEPHRYYYWKQVILWVGTLGDTCELDKVVELCQPFLSNDTGLVVVGGGHKLDHYKDKYRRLSIEFTGKLNQSEVAQYMKGADVCVNWYSNTDANRARSSLKVLEYLAVGTPVISNTVGELAKLKKNFMAGDTIIEFRRQLGKVIK